MAARPKYAGVLRKPIYFHVPFFPSEEVEADEQEALMKAFTERTLALYAHYGLKPNVGNAVALALALAKDHIPGFRIVYEPPRRPGRPRRESGPQKDLGLCRDVIQLETQGGLSVTRACQLLSKRSAYAGVSPKTLERRYYIARATPVYETAKAAARYEMEAERCAETLKE
jgi:hypothetical protein